MEAVSVWTIYPSADRQELDALVECAAKRLSIQKPDTYASAGVATTAPPNAVPAPSVMAALASPLMARAGVARNSTGRVELAQENLPPG